MKNSKYFKLIFPLFISSLFCCHNKRSNERVKKMMKLTNIAYALCIMLIKWALGIWHARTSAIWAGCEQHSIHFGVDEHQLECAICKGQNANILKRKIPFKRRYSHTRISFLNCHRQYDEFEVIKTTQKQFAPMNVMRENTFVFFFVISFTSLHWLYILVQSVLLYTIYIALFHFVHWFWKMW